MEKMNLRQVFGWALYDLANTSFSALFITLFFPLFIVEVLGGNEFHVGLIFGISFILAGLFVPFFGAVADAYGNKKKPLIIFTLICISLTSFVGFSNLLWAIILGIAATFFYHACLDIYDALLMDVSTGKNRGTVSGIGIALGYAGTILSLIMAYILFTILGWDSDQGIKIIFPATSIFFLFFSIASFILLKEKKSRVKPFKASMQKAFFEIKITLTKIYKFKKVFLFLISSLLYTDGMNIVIVFFYLFARDQIGIELQPFFLIFGVMAIASGIGALVFGKLSDEIGPKTTLVITQVMWMFVVGLLYISISYTNFLIAGIVGALALGGVWTVTRPMLMKLAPKHKIAEFFGFQGLTEKFSGGIGPFLFGAAVVAFGYKVAMLIPLISFILALIILLRIKVQPKVNV